MSRAKTAPAFESGIRLSVSSSQEAGATTAFAAPLSVFAGVLTAEVKEFIIKYNIIMNPREHKEVCGMGGERDGEAGGPSRAGVSAARDSLIDGDASVDSSGGAVASGESAERSAHGASGDGPGIQLVRGPVPLYHQAYNALRREIDSGRWGPGDRLPTERELGESFGCSLVTVRRALDELVREGSIVRTRGRGTFVRERAIERELADLTSFTAEMALKGLTPRTETLSTEIVESTPSTAERLGIEPGLPVYSIERLRIVGDEPLLLEHVFIPEHFFPGLLSIDLNTTSLYAHLSERYGVDLVGGHETLEPALPSDREARLLKQDRGEPVLLLKLVSSSADGRPIEYCRTVVKGSRAKYHIDVSRPRTE